MHFPILPARPFAVHWWALQIGCLIVCASCGQEGTPDSPGVEDPPAIPASPGSVEQAGTSTASSTASPDQSANTVPHPATPVVAEETLPEEPAPGTTEDPEEWVPLESWLGEPVVTKRETHPDGRLARIRTVLPGVTGPEGFHGPEMVYHNNGLMKLVKTWNRGQPEGNYRTWFPTGQVKRYGSFTDGELHGEFVEYKKAGTKSFEAAYIQGQLNGRVVEYYADERIKDESYWDAGKQIGTHTSWSIGEVLILEEEFADGLPHGMYRTFYPTTGTKRIEGSFEQGVRSGYWRGFDEETRLVLEEFYSSGQRNGERTGYAEGVLIERSNYVNGSLHGKKEEFFESGAPRSAGQLDMGKRVGAWSFWNLDGSLIDDLSGIYDDDRRVGPLPLSDD